MAYGSRVVLNEGCERVVRRVTAALADQDLVVLTELDLRAAMQTKLDVAIPDQVVLGVASASVAAAALSVEPSLGLLLPVPVVIRAEAPEVTVVEAVDPVVMVAITGDRVLEPVAADCAARLAAALHSL
jgi:uncharacterized protein (DUF302 family)